jgi:hypothetical protein
MQITINFLLSSLSLPPPILFYQKGLSKGREIFVCALIRVKLDEKWGKKFRGPQLHPPPQKKIKKMKNQNCLKC